MPEAEGAGPRAPAGRALLWKAVVVAAGLALLWFSLALTFSLVMAPRDASRALAWGIATPPVLANVATDLLKAQPPADVRDRAERYALRAARSDPVSVAALRALGLAAVLRNQPGRAETIFTLAEARSRRDFLTQVWLIEREVRRDDIVGALRHYDRALRTSRTAKDVLEPVLVQAAGQPAVAAPLGRLLASRPPWWSSFVERLVATDNAPASGLVAVLRAVNLRASDPYERGVLAAGLNRLVAAGAFAPALALYRQATSADRAGALVRDGRFAGESPVLPFDWQLHEDAALMATMEPREGAPGGMGLTILAEPGRTGEVARQLLLLRPGTYRLRAAAGFIPAAESARPVISVRCLGAARLDSSTGALRARLVPPSAGQRPVRAEAQLVVPEGCAAQWLRIEGQGGSERSAGDPPWIGDVAIEPMRG